MVNHDLYVHFYGCSQEDLEGSNIHNIIWKPNYWNAQDEITRYITNRPCIRCVNFDRVYVEKTLLQIYAMADYH